MSSVQQQSADEKRGTFLRKSSLQKLKCTAFYPLEVAGSICSKDSIKILLETTIVSAKHFIQKPVLVLCAQLACSVLTKITGKDVFQKLEKILNEYDQVKLKTKSKSYSVIRELKQRQNSKETSDVGDEKSAEQSPITEDNYDISNDCAKAEPKEDIRRLRFEEKPSKCIKNQYKYLEVMVHFSLVFVFAELIFLIYLLIGVYLPLGLVFLCTCLAMVGGFTVKILFMPKSEEKKPQRTVENQSNGATMKARPVVYVKPRVRAQELPETDIVVKKFI